MAVGEKVEHGSVKSAARMNSAVVIFLDQVEMVNQVVEAGLAVGDLFVFISFVVLDELCKMKGKTSAMMSLRWVV